MGKTREKQLYEQVYYCEKNGPKLCKKCHNITRVQRRQRKYPQIEHFFIQSNSPELKCTKCKEEINTIKVSLSRFKKILRMQEKLFERLMERKQLEIIIIDRKPQNKQHPYKTCEKQIDKPNCFKHTDPFFCNEA